MQQPEPGTLSPEEEKQLEAPPQGKTRGGSKKKLDRGKILALHNAGWTQKAIAEEIGCSEGSVSMILKEEKEKYHE